MIDERVSVGGMQRTVVVVDRGGLSKSTNGRGVQR